MLKSDGIKFYTFLLSFIFELILLLSHFVNKKHNENNNSYHVPLLDLGVHIS